MFEVVAMFAIGKAQKACDALQLGLKNYDDVF